MSNKSSSNFWKKFGLGKKTSSAQVTRPPSIQSQAALTINTPRANEDNRAIKNKRFSGVFLQRKQSTNSVKRLCQPSNHNTAPSPSELESKQPPGATIPTSPLPPPLPLPPSSQSTLEHQNYQSNHVESSTPPLNSDLGIQQDEDSDNTFDVITYDEAQTDEQPSLTTEELNTKSGGTSVKQINKPPPTRLVKPKSINDLKKTPQPSPSRQSSKSCLRKPTNTNAVITGSTTLTTQKETTISPLPTSSSMSSLTSSANPPIPFNPDGTNATHDQKDQLIQQLQDALQMEQSINSALQGQKEAITKDLDYFSLTVDELMEEKETLLQKYEEEKLKSQSKDQDLNDLLDKLKSSTDNARERSKEVDQWKAEIENTKEEASLEREKLKAVLKQKDHEIIRLKNEASDGKEEIKILLARIDQLVQETAHQKSTCQGSQSPSNHHHSPAAIETPNASPQLDAQQYIPHDDFQLHEDLSQQQQQQQQQQQPTVKTTGTRMALPKRVHPTAITTTNTTTATSPNNALDNELMSLTKEKEKLQSDYSKIPLSGGGHTSRRRKEHLEEMLDEVDSQLSKVKQKIRRS
ncbi:hypothetical protein BCR42DRAFT_424376 [Absidia repens]|uniref:Enkurin domain-containing protein n=1 Tax=Absidia repens TaxID=90262 RepID=A0A1X2I437_9FUNG|nr:hypothetical protein BCR42DRAFT_424376 [Absidia repens]